MQHLLRMLATYQLLWLKSPHEEQIIMCFYTRITRLYYVFYII